MFPNIETIPLLPKEIDIFKNHIIRQADPIRREVFHYSLVSYIIKNTVPFPVSTEYYYDSYPGYLSEEEFMKTLALNYIGHKLYLNNRSAKNINIEIKDLLYSGNFIKTFFEYNLPIKDRGTNKIVWIYPKLSFKTFISNSFFNKNYNNYFYNEVTLIRLIMIMAGFSKYEINNLDSYASKHLGQINYPSLILANIGLYEKEIIKIKDGTNGISVYLDLNAKGEKQKIFSTNKRLLKRTIIEVINETEGVSYNMKDFL